MSDIDTEPEPGPRAFQLTRFFKAPEWGLVAGILAVLAVVYLLDRDHAFFQEHSLRLQENVLKSILQRVALFGVLAVGAAVVIIAGGIDLSTGAVVALSSVVSAKLLTEWLHTGTSGPPPSVGVVALAIALTLLMGMTIGITHACMINWLRLPPFIATLATMAGLRSLATLICQNKTITVPFDAYRAMGKEVWLTVSIFAAVATSMSILMGCTVLGRHLFALGGNELAARLSGLRTNRLKIAAYALSGTLSALGGILFCGFTGQADSRLGTTYELTAITAAVVGGCSLAGGVGSIRGTVLGLLLTQIVIKGTGIVVRGIDSTQIEGLVLGTVVLVAVAFNERFRRGRA
jgi:ribose/xylose/arabinose/galactoside ABC-type transport system permease subunit